MPGQRHLRLGDGPGDAEVRDLHPPVATDQDVAGLHVAVDDPPGVGRLEGSRGLGGDPGGLARRQRPGASDDRGEVLALDDLHDDERAGLVLAVVVDRDDVRVVERRRVLRLLAEARAEVGVPAVLGAKQLDGDVAIELAVVGPVDGRHAALSEQLDQPIPAAENRPEFRHACPPLCRPAGRPHPRAVTRRGDRSVRRPAERLSDGLSVLRSASAAPSRGNRAS